MFLTFLPGKTGFFPKIMELYNELYKYICIFMYIYIYIYIYIVDYNNVFYINKYTII